MAIKSDPELAEEFGSLPAELRDLNTLRNTLAHYSGVVDRTIVVSTAADGVTTVEPESGPYDPIVFFRSFDGQRHEVALGDTVARLNERSEEHTSELQSLMRISYAVFCLKKQTTSREKLYKLLTK